MTKRAEILAKFELIVQEVLDDDSIEIEENTVATNVPGWDSFNHINIVVATEKELKVSFFAHEIETLHNVGEFVDLIARKLGV